MGAIDHSTNMVPQSNFFSKIKIELANILFHAC